MSQFYKVMGLEVHLQLLTASKLFSSAANCYGGEPNAHCDAVDLGLPGALPYPNRDAIDLAIRFGLMTHASIPAWIQFDRKSYFYPDLPKGYQTTQHHHPVVQGGWMDIEVAGEVRRIRIHHAHLEEDAGKMFHHAHQSELDFNRAGVPLLEVVTEPDFRSTEEVIAFLKKLHQWVRYFGICDANMQEGSFRVDVNISVRLNESDPFGTRVEIKNVNSFKFIEKAIEFESKRQASILNAGGSIQQETRKFDEATNSTLSLRKKENAEDYRYFRDPDLPRIHISKAYVDQIAAMLPVSPDEKKQVWLELGVEESDFFLQDAFLMGLLEALLAQGLPGKLVANWLIGPIQALLNKHACAWSQLPLSLDHLSTLLKAVHEEHISSSQGKTLLEELWSHPQDPWVLIRSRGLQQITDLQVIEQWIQEVFIEHANVCDQYRAGQTKLLAFLVGQVLKKSSGKAHPQLVQHAVERALQ